ncbi:hypothetical protein BD769DRAFT_375724 [Suillus cothurnatus]|nr:hypothetical protein BD769DRAFT_375724 [Suillus cothurnatus]
MDLYTRLNPGPKALGSAQKPANATCRPLVSQTNAIPGPSMQPSRSDSQAVSIPRTRSRDLCEQARNMLPLARVNSHPQDNANFDFDNEYHPEPVLIPDINQELPLLRCQQLQYPPDQNFQPAALPDVREPGVDQDEADAPSLVPVTFKENDEIRYAYFTTVMANVYGHLSWNQATNQLNQSQHAPDCECTPTFPRPV